MKRIFVALVLSLPTLSFSQDAAAVRYHQAGLQYLTQLTSSWNVPLFSPIAKTTRFRDAASAHLALSAFDRSTSAAFALEELADRINAQFATREPVRAIAALTTMVGFGSLVTSAYPGLRSMGLVALLGTLFSLVTTMTILVALLELFERKSPMAPRDAATERTNY